MKSLLRKSAAGAIAIVLLLSMLLLTGCGSGKESDSGNDTKTTSGASVSDSEGTSPTAASQAQVSDTLKKLREKGTLIVGSSGDAPFAYIDQESGEFKGVDAEIIKEAAKRLGINKVEMKLIPFSELILNLNSSNIDIICDCMYVRADRAEQVYFGDIWYTQGGGLLVDKDSGISGTEDFDPKTTVVGYTPGTVWQTTVEGWQKQGLIKEARATGDQSESIVALQYKKIDAFLTDSTVVENLFANTPDTVKGLKMAENYKDDESAIGKIAPAVKFSDIAFMKELNDVIVQMRDDGFIEQVFKDYKLDPKLHMITDDQRFHKLNTREE